MKYWQTTCTSSRTARSSAFENRSELRGVRTGGVPLGKDRDMLNMARVMEEVPIQVFSSTNEWIDCIFLVDKDDAKQAAEVLDEAMNRWFDDDSQIPYGDYLEREMDARGIEYEVYFRGGSDDEWS